MALYVTRRILKVLKQYTCGFKKIKILIVLATL